GTTANGINPAHVILAASYDGGFTFSRFLTTPNTGSATFQVPNVATTQARFRIEASNNIFYDINNANLVITATPTSTLVTNANDSGNGSLRSAVNAANVVIGGTQDITFEPSFFATPRTITL